MDYRKSLWYFTFLYVDEPKLRVCDNLRICHHQVFKDIAKRGKSSIGWFSGLKLHPIINNREETMNLKLTLATQMIELS